MTVIASTVEKACEEQTRGPMAGHQESHLSTTDQPRGGLPDATGGWTTNWQAIELAHHV